MSKQNEAELVDVLQEASKRKKVVEICAGVPASDSIEIFPEGEQAKKLTTESTEKVAIKKEEKKE